MITQPLSEKEMHRSHQDEPSSTQAAQVGQARESPSNAKDGPIRMYLWLRSNIGIILERENLVFSLLHEQLAVALMVQANSSVCGLWKCCLRWLGDVPSRSAG